MHAMIHVNRPVFERMTMIQHSYCGAMMAIAVIATLFCCLAGSAQAGAADDLANGTEYVRHGQYVTWSD